MPNKHASADFRGIGASGIWPRSCSRRVAGRSDGVQSKGHEGAMTLIQGICRTALAACVVAAAGMALGGAAQAQTQGTIKIGVLHSLSGTMAISETTLKDTILMMVDDINKKGVAADDIRINYTPFGYSDWQTEVAAIKKFAAGGKKTAVVSTINGDANVPFYKELSNAGIKASDIPVVAFSVGEEELAGIDTKNLIGHLAAWNYFQSVKNPTNDAFIKQWKEFIKNPKRVTNDPMEAHYTGFKMWVHAVQQAGTTDIDAVRQAMYGQKVKAPSGFIEVMNTNHHLSKPVMIGEIRPDGQFDVVWQTKEAIKADAWSPYLPEDKGKIADWTYPWVCGNCTAAKFTD